MGGRNDDPSGIPDGTRLFRRIDPNQVVYDANKGEPRPTSKNFQNSKDDDSMSVFAENVATAHGERPIDFLRGRWSGWYLVALTAGGMRGCGQIVFLDPANQDPDERYFSHAAVCGSKDHKTRQKIGAHYQWIVSPPNSSDPPK